MINCHKTMLLYGKMLIKHLKLGCFMVQQLKTEKQCVIMPSKGQFEVKTIMAHILKCHSKFRTDHFKWSFRINKFKGYNLWALLAPKILCTGKLFGVKQHAGSICTDSSICPNPFQAVNLKAKPFEWDQGIWISPSVCNVRTVGH